MFFWHFVLEGPHLMQPFPFCFLFCDPTLLLGEHQGKVLPFLASFLVADVHRLFLIRVVVIGVHCFRSLLFCLCCWCLHICIIVLIVVSAVCSKTFEANHFIFAVVAVTVVLLVVGFVVVMSVLVVLFVVAVVILVFWLLLLCSIRFYTRGYFCFFWLCSSSHSSVCVSPNWVHKRSAMRALLTAHVFNNVNIESWKKAPQSWIKRRNGNKKTP